MKTRIQQITLHCTSGTSNKFYTIEIDKEDAPGTMKPWSVHTKWGRIGKPPQDEATEIFRTQSEASRYFNDKRAEKENKKDYFKVPGSDSIKPAAAAKPVVKEFDPFDL